MRNLKIDNALQINDVKFFRKVTLIGSVLLMGMSAMMYFDQSINDQPLIRILISLFLLAIGFGSFKSEWIKKNGMQLMYITTSVYVVYAIYITSLNNFQVYDTSTTMILSFALGALFRDKKFLLGYLIMVFTSFIFFFLMAKSPEVNESYLFGTMSLMMVLAYLIYSGKISTVNELKQSQYRLEESEERFRNIFEYSPLGIILIDSKGKIFKANTVISELFQYAEDQLIGQSVEYLLDNEDPFNSIDLIKKLKTSDLKSMCLEQKMFSKDGNKIWGRNTMSLIDADLDNEAFVICMIQDQSFEIEAKYKLEEYASKLKTHNKSLEEFSYVISHDLQEPLRMISSYSEIIKRKYISQIEDENAHLDVSYVIDGSKRMSQLIKDMLAYSRWSAKPFEKELVDTGDVLVGVLKNLTMALSENEAEIYCEPLPALRTNKVLLAQVLQNLIGNGIKYSQKGRKPVIEISAEEKDFEIQITIKDNGQGFNEKDKERIFGIFQRLHGKQSEYKGTGIGLAICKRVIEKQGGSIWAEGEPGVGASFYFTLPKDQVN